MPHAVQEPTPLLIRAHTDRTERLIALVRRWVQVVRGSELVPVPVPTTRPPRPIAWREPGVVIGDCRVGMEVKQDRAEQRRSDLYLRQVDAVSLASLTLTVDGGD